MCTVSRKKTMICQKWLDVLQWSELLIDIVGYGLDSLDSSLTSNQGFFVGQLFWPNLGFFQRQIYTVYWYTVYHLIYHNEFMHETYRIVDSNAPINHIKFPLKRWVWFILKCKSDRRKVCGCCWRRSANKFHRCVFQWILLRLSKVIWIV